MRNSLLWVYEGLTQYFGDVLAVRSGIWTPEQYHDILANKAALLDTKTGRTWRDLQDTANMAQVLYESGGGWDNWRRSTDFYDEGELTWLDVDTTIRKMTNNKKSIDDFVAKFAKIAAQLRLEIGQPLPTLPIWLKENWAISLDLDSSYEETCRTLRIR